MKEGYKGSPKHRYTEQKAASRKRVDKLGSPIHWNLSFVEWMKVWEESEHWHERGTSKGQYVMSRIDDIGHYEMGNIVIKLSTDNVSEGQKCRKFYPSMAGEKNGMYGRTHSPEAIQKIRNSQLGRKHTPEQITKRITASVAARKKNKQLRLTGEI